MFDCQLFISQTQTHRKAGCVHACIPICTVGRHVCLCALVCSGIFTLSHSPPGVGFKRDTLLCTWAQAPLGLVLFCNSLLSSFNLFEMVCARWHFHLLNLPVLQGYIWSGLQRDGSINRLEITVRKVTLFLSSYPYEPCDLTTAMSL